MKQAKYIYIILLLISAVSTQNEAVQDLGTEVKTSGINSPKKSGKLVVKTKDWGPEFSEVQKLFGRATEDREELAQLRQKNADRYFKMREEQNPNFIQLAQDVTEETIQYIKKRISQTIEKLGPAPTDFAIITMGSMARQESGLYTDLEIGILVKEKNIEVIRYFQKFAQMLSDRFFLLGEHPDVGGKGFRMDEADNSPAHLKFFARYSCEEQAKSLLKSALEKREFDKIPFEGSRIFISTPVEFAQHMSPDYLAEDAQAEKIPDSLLEKEIELAVKDPANRGRGRDEIVKEVKNYFNILLKPLNPRERQISASLEALSRNIQYLYGDKRLFDEYMQIREKILTGKPKLQNPFYQNRREEIAYSEMKKDLLKYLNKPEAAIVTGKLGKEIDIKRELYRFPEQILTNLGFWYNLGEQNTSKIAQLLAQKGIISAELSKQLIEYMNFIIGLRFKKQAICKKQTHAVPTTVQEYSEQLEELQADLKKLQTQRDFMLKSHSPSADFEKVDKDISKVQQEIVDMKKLKPLEAGSILSTEEISLLNTKYLPFLKKLFEAAESFIKGNKKAFLEIDFKQTPVAVPASQNIATSASMPERTTASSAPQSISQAELERMLINGEREAIVDALINNRVELNAVAQAASKNKKVPEYIKIHKEFVQEKRKQMKKK